MWYENEEFQSSTVSQSMIQIDARLVMPGVSSDLQRCRIAIHYTRVSKWVFLPKCTLRVKIKSSYYGVMREEWTLSVFQSFLPLCSIILHKQLSLCSWNLIIFINQTRRKLFLKGHKILDDLQLQLSNDWITLAGISLPAAPQIFQIYLCWN